MTTDNATEAFTAFAREVEPRLRLALVAAFGVDAGVEAAADAMAYGWEHWETLRERENPAGYLFGVGRNKARRHRRVRPMFPETPYGHELSVEPGLPAALGKLSQRQRVAVVLIHSEDWTYAEVADLFGVSVSTAQQHAERGMSKLRRSIGVTS